MRGQENGEGQTGMIGNGYKRALTDFEDRGGLATMKERTGRMVE